MREHLRDGRMTTHLLQSGQPMVARSGHDIHIPPTKQNFLVYVQPGQREYTFSQAAGAWLLETNQARQRRKPIRPERVVAEPESYYRTPTRPIILWIWVDMGDY